MNILDILKNNKKGLFLKFIVKRGEKKRIKKNRFFNFFKNLLNNYYFFLQIYLHLITKKIN